MSPRKSGKPNALRKAALLWARDGYRVFPCEPRGKKPLIRKWRENATTDEEMIQRWWRKWPDANVGLVAGRTSDLWVLDIDGQEGDDSLTRLEQKHGTLRQTWEAVTGGGWHLYFGMPSDGRDIRNSAGQLGQGLDVRGTGGYVIEPPSVHPGGETYAWVEGSGPDDVKLADAPAWLLELVTESATRQAKSPREWRKLVAEGVPKGQRNDTIARLAGHLLRHRADPVETLDLCQAWNAYRCRPPLEEDEVARTVLSIAKHEMSARGSSDE